MAQTATKIRPVKASCRRLEKRIGQHSTDIQLALSCVFPFPGQTCSYRLSRFIGKSSTRRRAPYSTNIIPEGSERCLSSHIFSDAVSSTTLKGDHGTTIGLKEGITKNARTSVGGVDSRPDPTVAYPCMTCDKTRTREAVGKRWDCRTTLIDGSVFSTGIPEEESIFYRPLY